MLCITKAMTIDSDNTDEEELCQVLQTHIKTLEQQELAQMRQNAILQRKLDSAEKQLCETRQQQKLELDAVERRLRDQREALTSESNSRYNKAAENLEAELNERMDAAGQREDELEQSVRHASSQCRELEKDLAYWRCCGQELLRGVAVDIPNREGQVTDTLARTAEHDTQVARLTSEIRGMRQSCVDFESRLPELERMAYSARAEEEQLRSHNAGLDTSVARRNADIDDMRKRAAASSQQEQALCDSKAVIEARMARQLEAARHRSQAAPSRDGTGEEASYLHRRLEERKQEVAALMQENTRLHGALQRHTGLESQHGSAAINVPGSGGRGPCIAFDEPVTWFAMLLFKSNFVRRAFCVHLALLYSWLLFLLWYMSTMVHQQMLAEYPSRT